LVDETIYDDLGVTAPPADTEQQLSSSPSTSSDINDGNNDNDDDNDDGNSGGGDGGGESDDMVDPPLEAVQPDAPLSSPAFVVVDTIDKAVVDPPQKSLPPPPPTKRRARENIAVSPPKRDCVPSPPPQPSPSPPPPPPPPPEHDELSEVEGEEDKDTTLIRDLKNWIESKHNGQMSTEDAGEFFDAHPEHRTILKYVIKAIHTHTHTHTHILHHNFIDTQ
jgi:hypothetical protein